MRWLEECFKITLSENILLKKKNQKRNFPKIFVSVESKFKNRLMYGKQFLRKKNLILH